MGIIGCNLGGRGGGGGVCYCVPLYIIRSLLELDFISHLDKYFVFVLVILIDCYVFIIRLH